MLLSINLYVMSMIQPIDGGGLVSLAYFLASGRLELTRILLHKTVAIRQLPTQLPPKSHQLPPNSHQLPPTSASFNQTYANSLSTSCQTSINFPPTSTNFILTSFELQHFNQFQPKTQLLDQRRESALREMGYGVVMGLAFQNNYP